MKTLFSLVTSTALLISAPAFAETLLENSSLINGNVLQGQGRIGVNMAAGDQNAQINAAALAVSYGQGAHATLDLQQNVRLTEAEWAHDSTSTITENAFSNATGVISVNQVSGLGNAQVNAVAIGLGIEGEAITEIGLASATTGYNAELAPTDTGHREARIDDKAFDGSSGLIQVNQLAGSGNATANSFQLNISLGLDNEQ
tara:strand:- start:170 stop:772 length:603 start_codon:yes stop_codon:yes gene_type:complete